MESSAAPTAPPTLAAPAQLPTAPLPMAAPGSLAALQRPLPAAPPPSAIQTANAQLNAQLAAARATANAGAAVNGYAQPPRALPAYVPTRPPGASSYGRVPLPEATKLQIRLETPNGVRTGQDLVVDKRQVVLHLAAKDDRDGDARLPVVISLVFEDQSALPAHAAPSAITGKTVNAVEGAANIKLSIKAMSSAHERRRFRIRVGPQDASLAAELPDLVQHTEPFSMVHTTAKMLGATPSSRGAAHLPSQPHRAVRGPICPQHWRPWRIALSIVPARHADRRRPYDGHRSWGDGASHLAMPSRLSRPCRRGLAGSPRAP